MRWNGHDDPSLPGEVDDLAALARPGSATYFGGQGVGWLEELAGHSRRLTGTTDPYQLAFDVTIPAAGRPAVAVDLLLTKVAGGVAATAGLQPVAKASLQNDETFTVPAATLVLGVPEAVVFFFDVDGNSVTPEDDTHVKVDVSAATDLDSVGEALAALFTAPPIALLWNAAYSMGASLVILTRSTPGGDLNGTPLTETVADPGFVAYPIEGGVDAALVALNVTIAALDIEATPILTELAACPDPAGHLEPAVDETLTFAPEEHVVPAGASLRVLVTGQLALTTDMVTVRACRVRFA